MDIDFNDIRTKLEKIGILMSLESVKLNSQQGGVNEVYVADSNKGKLIIHVGKFSDAVEQAQKGERAFGVSKFLKARPKIPVVEVILYGSDSTHNHFCVERFVEGERLDEMSNKFQQLRHLAEILANLHQIEVSGVGHLRFSEGQIKGVHTDWLIFLKGESFKCLDNIYAAKKDQKDSPLSEQKHQELRQKLILFFDKYQNIFAGISGKLIHGDILFSNILVKGERINALIDLEWSLAGDPAWEFAGFVDERGKNYPDYENLLKEYFACLKNMGVSIDEANFRLRIKLYWVIKLLFIGNTFRKFKHFDWALQRFDEEIVRLLD